MSCECPRVVPEGPLRRRDLRLDDIHDARVRERAEVAELVGLARDDLPHDATHDLPRVHQHQTPDNKHASPAKADAENTEHTLPERVFGRSETR